MDIYTLSMFNRGKTEWKKEREKEKEIHMEEIHETAKAYYDNLTENQKQNANKMFLSMDLNGDGSVSISECVENLGKMGFKSCNKPEFLMKLDRNGDGNLDFEEFLSLYYLIKSDRLVFCDGHGCGAFLKGVYFTCLDCFYLDEKSTYDLCLSCVKGKNFRHIHDSFMDNFALLRCKAASCTHVKPSWCSQLEHSSRRLRSSTSTLPSQGSGFTSSNQMKKMEEASAAFEMGFSIADTIAEISNNECSIM